MRNTEKIYEKAMKIMNSSGSCDMKKLAKSLGITVYFENDYKNLMGMYTAAFKRRTIFINANLDENLTQLVLAHEIGHDALHRDLARKNTFQEFKLFRMKDNTEYEANAFASHLLLDTEEFIALSKQGYTISEIANCMNTEINMALIKQNELAELGYHLKKPDYTKSDFLKSIKAE
ncbi:MAG: ImmA/IrrE family metallo-endopeptidase [Bacillota bacterium]